MERRRSTAAIGPGCLAALALVAGQACRPLSEQVRDPAAGRNGGFEQVRSGLPVNWLVYSPSTVPSGRFELIFDEEDAREGARSLRFLVHECSPDGGWRSPGLCQEFRVGAGTTQTIGFWIKNDGCDWRISYGAVSAKTAEVETVTSSDAPDGEWAHVERTYTLPDGYDRLRFELSIRSPGSLWIDDVTIDPVAVPQAPHRPG